jgi:hypothetical protein
MKMPDVLIGFVAMLMLSPLSVQAGPVNEGKSDSCALLKPADLTTLLGGTPIANPKPGGCNWTASGSTKQLTAIVYQNTGMAAEMAFSGAKKNAAKGGGTVTNEAGLGDRAFARLESFGVSLMTIKQGRLLQLQYGAGMAGTVKDLDALRPVAKKAIDAL